MSNLSTQMIDHILADLCDRGNVCTSKSLPPFLNVISLQTHQMPWTLLFFAIGTPQSRSSDYMRRYRKRKLKASGLFLVSGEYSSSRVSPPF